MELSTFWIPKASEQEAVESHEKKGKGGVPMN